MNKDKVFEKYYKNVVMMEEDIKGLKEILASKKDVSSKVMKMYEDIEETYKSVSRVKEYMENKKR